MIISKLSNFHSGKIFCLLFVIFLVMNRLSAQDKPVLLYIGDPMCSWCYGFAPEMTKIADELKEEVEIGLIMGGLRPYNTQTMTDLADFLEEHWMQVSDRSGQPFTYDILQKNYVYDTEPPARACVVMRQLQPAKELAFFKDLQTLFYRDNKDMNSVESYLPTVKKYGVDPTEFRKLFSSPELKIAVRADFEKAAALDVSGFPSLILRKGEEYYLIASGYTEAEKVLRTVRRILD